MTARLLQANLTAAFFFPHFFPMNSRMYSIKIPLNPIAIVRGSISGIRDRTLLMIAEVPEGTSLRPTSEPTWPKRIVMAAADRNPDRTGTEMYSRMNPSLSSPTMSEYMPTINATADEISCAAKPSVLRSVIISAVRRPMMEVGPVERSGSRLDNDCF